MEPCGCYYGYDCTKTTVCAIESAVEDCNEQTEHLLEAFEELANTRISHNLLIWPGEIMKIIKEYRDD